MRSRRSAVQRAALPHSPPPAGRNAASPCRRGRPCTAAQLLRPAPDALRSGPERAPATAHSYLAAWARPAGRLKSMVDTAFRNHSSNSRRSHAAPSPTGIVGRFNGGAPLAEGSETSPNSKRVGGQVIRKKTSPFSAPARVRCCRGCPVKCPDGFPDFALPPCATARPLALRTGCWSGSE